MSWVAFDGSRLPRPEGVSCGPTPEFDAWVAEIEVLDAAQGTAYDTALEAVVLAAGHASWLCQDQAGTTFRFASVDGKQSATVVLEDAKVILCEVALVA